MRDSTLETGVTPTRPTSVYDGRMARDRLERGVDGRESDEGASEADVESPESDQNLATVDPKRRRMEDLQDWIVMTPEDLSNLDKSISISGVDTRKSLQHLNCQRTCADQEKVGNIYQIISLDSWVS